jgi:hypothetical protein
MNENGPVIAEILWHFEILKNKLGVTRYRYNSVGVGVPRQSQSSECVWSTGYNVQHACCEGIKNVLISQQPVCSRGETRVSLS